MLWLPGSPSSVLWLAIQTFPLSYSCSPCHLPYRPLLSRRGLEGRKNSLAQSAVWEPRFLVLWPKPQSCTVPTGAASGQSGEREEKTKGKNLTTTPSHPPPIHKLPLGVCFPPSPLLWFTFQSPQIAALCTLISPLKVVKKPERSLYLNNTPVRWETDRFLPLSSRVSQMSRFVQTLK